MTIRVLNSQDIKANEKSVYEYLETCFRITYQRTDDTLIGSKVERLIKYLDMGKAFACGAFIEEKMVGFLWGYPVESIFETVFHIAYIAVDKSGQRQGIGKSLLAEAEKQAKKLGLSDVELIVGASNNNAIQFYLNAGYEADRFVMRRGIK